MTDDERAELEHLRRWKAEALPVMAGLQEVGRALGLRLGESITGRTAVDAALDLRNTAAAAQAQAVLSLEQLLAAETARLADRQPDPSGLLGNYLGGIRTALDHLRGEREG